MGLQNDLDGQKLNFKTKVFFFTFSNLKCSKFMQIDHIVFIFFCSHAIGSKLNIVFCCCFLFVCLFFVFVCLFVCLFVFKYYSLILLRAE